MAPHTNASRPPAGTGSLTLDSLGSGPRATCAGSGRWPKRCCRSRLTYAAPRRRSTRVRLTLPSPLSATALNHLHRSLAGTPPRRHLRSHPKPPSENNPAAQNPAAALRLHCHEPIPRSERHRVRTPTRSLAGTTPDTRSSTPAGFPAEHQWQAPWPSRKAASIRLTANATKHHQNTHCCVTFARAK